MAPAWQQRVRALLSRLRAPAGTNAAAVFTNIYTENRWGCDESRSGPGSSIDATAPLREALQRWLRAHAIKSILDIPCGDFHWMRHVDLTGISYTGADIVPELIAENNRAHADTNRSFVVLDLVRDPLPRADLVIVRDGLVHLPLLDVQRALDNIRHSSCTYAAITQFDGVKSNAEIRPGQWRPLDLCAAPFNWPPPDEALPEFHHPAAPKDLKKSLSIWRISSLKK